MTSCAAAGDAVVVAPVVVVVVVVVACLNTHTQTHTVSDHGET